MPRTDAAGADLDAAHGAVVYGFYFLKVWMPGTPGLVVGMTDIISEAGTFPAYFAFF
jgi:hypothetical protein